MRGRGREGSESKSVFDVEKIEISSLLRNKSIPSKSRARVYDACIWPVLLHSAETWG